jgi:DNA modification methylase
MMNSKYSLNDEYYTTFKIWESIRDYIPKNKIIWECFYSPNSKSATHLRNLGFEVVWKDVDFFTNNYGDILVSNMPFSKKKDVLTRLKQLDKPFIMLFPTSSIQTKFFKNLFENDKIQIILPSEKLNYEGDSTHPRGASFYSCFICYKMDFDKDVILI